MSDYINGFLRTNNFVRADVLFPSGIKCTYVNDALGQYNKLDYFVYDNINVTAFDVIDPDVNFSDHLPITIDLCINVSRTACAGRFFPDVSEGRPPRVIKLRWDHADLRSYYDYTVAAIIGQT